jgi:hypothetical protein
VCTVGQYFFAPRHSTLSAVSLAIGACSRFGRAPKAWARGGGGGSSP